MSQVTIYHNPACSKCRSTLELIREAGIEPRVVEYLRDRPTREELAQLIAAAGLSVREAMRDPGPALRELHLDDLTLSDEQLLDAMLAHPDLISRPFVVTARGTRLCRPPERVLEILPTS